MTGLTACLEDGFHVTVEVDARRSVWRHRGHRGRRLGRRLSCDRFRGGRRCCGYCGPRISGRGCGRTLSPR
jgi:hypothetical protein